MKLHIAIALAAGSLGGCSNPQPISNAPGSAIVQQAEATPIGKQFAKDLIDAAYNNNQAVAIGVLPPDDPIVGCVNDAVTKLGFDPQTGQPIVTTGVQQFTPKIVGPLSLGAVGYIGYQQLQASGALGTPSLTSNCYAVIGKLVWDVGISAAQNAIGKVPAVAAVSAMIKLIDLYHLNTVVSFADVKASGVVGVLHKFSQGSDFKDPLYTQRRQDALSAGLLWGRYHFGDHSNVQAQVNNFMTDHVPGEQLALDWEDYAANQMTFEDASTFAAGVRTVTGVWPALYSGDLIKAVASPGVLVNCKLWLAEWARKPNLPNGFTGYWLWQHTNTGICPGISGYVDMSWFNGKPKALTWSWGK